MKIKSKIYSIKTTKFHITHCYKGGMNKFKKETPKHIFMQEEGEYIIIGKFQNMKEAGDYCVNLKRKGLWFADMEFVENREL